MLVGGIFGPKKSGKTTLAAHLSKEYWLSEKRPSYVLDPNSAGWPDSCWVAPNADEEIFWSKVWSVQNGLIICDDAAASVNRDKDLIDVFTRINHNGHKLLIVGHSGTNLLPIMREQMDTLYLFKTSPKAAEMWFEIFPNEEIFSAPKLNRYEFLWVRSYEKPKKVKLKL